MMGYTRYAKKLILEKLNLQATDICLPAYLSWKGAEACPCSDREGHEEHDSKYHSFTEQQLALRPTCEEEPFRLPMEAGEPSTRQRRRAAGWKRWGGQGRCGPRQPQMTVAAAQANILHP